MVLPGRIPNWGLVKLGITPHASQDQIRTAQTVAKMRDLILRDRADPLVARRAREAIEALPASASQWQQAEAVFHWIKSNVRLKADPPEDELLIEPSLVVRLPPRLRAGDCDDFTMLAGAMLGALGIRSRIVTIKADRDDPSRFSHVYLEAFVEDGPIAFDASHGPELGWAAPYHFGRREWRVAMNGLGTIWPTAQQQAQVARARNRILGGAAILGLLVWFAFMD